MTVAGSSSRPHQRSAGTARSSTGTTSRYSARGSVGRPAEPLDPLAHRGGRRHGETVGRRAAPGNPPVQGCPPAPRRRRWPGHDRIDSTSVVHAPGEGTAIWHLDTLMTFKALTEETGGRLAAWEELLPHRSSPPLHVHHDEDEAWFVLDGRADLPGRRLHLDRPRPAPSSGPPAACRTPSGSTPRPPGCWRWPFRAASTGSCRATGRPAEAATLPPPPDGPPDMAALVGRRPRARDGDPRSTPGRERPRARDSRNVTACRSGRRGRRRADEFLPCWPRRRRRRRAARRPRPTSATWCSSAPA